MKITSEYLVIAGIIVYIAFFTHPPPKFVALVLKSPVGQVLALLGVVAGFMRSPPIGLLLGVAYLTSSYPVLEYLDPKEQAPKPQPKSSGVPMPNKDTMDMLKGLIGKKGGKIPQEQGKSQTAPPPEVNKVKPAQKPFSTKEEYMNF